jgi:hypothetical protein
MPTINCICLASAETIARQPVFQATVSPKAADIEGIYQVEYRLELQFHPVIPGPDRPTEDRPLEPFQLPVYLYRLYICSPQIRSKEGLGRYIAINEDRLVTDCTGQDVRDRVEEGERVLPK